MKFSELASMIDGCMVLDEGLAFWEIGPDSRPCKLHSEKSSINLNLFVQAGKLRVAFAGRNYQIGAGCFANFIDQPQMEIGDYSTDLQAYAVYSTERYVTLMFKNTPPPFPFSYICRIKEQPIFTLPHTDSARFLLRLQNLAESMADKRHKFRTEMVKCAFWMFLIDVADMFIHQNTDETDPMIEPDSKRSLFLRFMHLLRSNIANQRQVSFYASKLCITPQYLNRVVRLCSGRTSYDWISSALIGEITQRLECSNDSIGHIAEELNFPDQAALTNFFKRQLDITPSDYRRTHSLLSQK